MHVFDVGQDFYSWEFLEQKLAWEIGAAILCAVIVFIGLHMLRRAFGPPKYEPEAAAPPPNVKRFQRFTVGARLYHWGNFVVIVLLLWSGAALFFPGIMFSLSPYVGFSWLSLHVVLAGVFIVFVILHILFAIFDTGLSQMWFHRGDGRDLAQRVRYYFAGRKTLPKYAKFDIGQKIYHALLAIFALVMIVTGASLFLSSEIIVTLGDEWLRWQRILHDVFAFLFAAVIIAHIYLRVIRARWPALISMVTGNISRDGFAREHDWNHWQPPTD